MKQVSAHSTIRWFLLSVAITVSPLLQAQPTQDEQREDGSSFAGGHMVRGTVVTSAADHLTIKTETGETYQVVASANTRLTKDRQPLKLTDIKVGDGIGAMGILDPATKTVHAVFIGVLDAEQVKKAREGLGKVYIIGRVTAIDMDTLKLTVNRPDGVNQVIGVDEQTSFRRGSHGIETIANGGVGDAANAPSPTNKGESITFADVKIGDSIAGRGAVKNGIFSPTELDVMDAAAMAQRRKRRSSESSSGSVQAPGPATTQSGPP